MHTLLPGQTDFSYNGFTHTCSLFVHDTNNLVRMTKPWYGILHALHTTMFCSQANLSGLLPDNSSGTNTLPAIAAETAAACRQAGGVEGIVNGMDSTDWSPNVDKFLDVKYDGDTVDEGKALAKETLQAELGLPVSHLILFTCLCCTGV